MAQTLASCGHALAAPRVWAVRIGLGLWLAAAPAEALEPTTAVDPAVEWTPTLAAIASRAGRWSQDRRWSELEASNLSEAPFAVPGRPPPASPADRMVQFATAALRPAPGASDDRAWCRPPTRWRRLQSLAAAEGLALPEASSCTALERFADPAVVVGMEILFVAPTSARSSASFGHLLLRLRHAAGGAREPSAAGGAQADGSSELQASDDVVYEISAITGFRHSDLAFLAGGMAGNYPLVFDPQSLNAVLADNLHGQQRSIQRFALNLTADQRRAVLRLLWQVERELALPYRFLNRNYGTYLLWLLATALEDGPALDPNIALWAAPA